MAWREAGGRFGKPLQWYDTWGLKSPAFSRGPSLQCGQSAELDENWGWGKGWGKREVDRSMNNAYMKLNRYPFSLFI